MHRDVVLAPLPDGAENLGSTDKCAVQGMISRSSSSPSPSSAAAAAQYISVQGHPEFTEEIVAEILTVRREAGIFTEDEFTDMMARSGKRQDGLVVAMAFLRFVAEGVVVDGGSA
jgi:hypothetical protein